jgi:hypothetical protein
MFAHRCGAAPAPHTHQNRARAAQGSVVAKHPARPAFDPLQTGPFRSRTERDTASELVDTAALRKSHGRPSRADAEIIWGYPTRYPT